jgi:uncharacterized membrane protein YbhN (UPF0104 family)
MRKYLIFIAFVFIFLFFDILIFSIQVPDLLSAKSTTMVIAGIILLFVCVIVAVICLWIIANSILDMVKKSLAKDQISETKSNQTEERANPE